MATVTITLKFVGADHSRAVDVVGHMLDVGTLQDAISEAARDLGYATSIESTTADAADVAGLAISAVLDAALFLAEMSHAPHMRREHGARIERYSEQLLKFLKEIGR